MNWNEELKSIKQIKTVVNHQKIAQAIFDKLKISVANGSSGMVFGFHIEPEVGKILTEQGLGYKTYKESDPDTYSFPFEESSVWIK